MRAAHRIPIVGLLFAFTAAPAIGRAQESAEVGELAGTVRDPRGVPVPRAQVFLADGRWKVTADDFGTFTVRGLEPGRWVLRARHFGFAPITDKVTIVAGRRHEVSLEMEPLPSYVLAAITVRGVSQRDRFRGLMAGARGLSRWNVESLEASGAFSVREFLQHKEPLVSQAQDQARWVASIGGAGAGDPCANVVYGTGCVGGILLLNNDQTGRRTDAPKQYQIGPRSCEGYDVYVNGARSSEALLDALDPADVEGVDFARYGAAGGMLGTCATVSVWTKPLPAPTVQPTP